MSESSFLLSSQPVSNHQASNRPARPLYSKSRIGFVTANGNNESSAANDEDNEEPAEFVEDTVCSGDSVSRVGESQSLLDNADDDDELFENSSQNISTTSDADIMTTANEVSNSDKLEINSKMSESELMMQPTQAPLSKLSESNLMDDKTQAVSKLSESEIMGAPTQAMSTSKLLSESQLLGLPTQAVISMSESQLMGLPTQAFMNSMSESQLYAADTQSVSLSKLSESELMGLPTQALVSGMSESQLYAADTQAVSASFKLSESDLMFASTQAVSASCKLSESELMFASTQAVNNKSSRISGSLLISAETQNISKCSDSELMSENTQAIASSPVVNESINKTEELSETNLMFAQTQFVQHEKNNSDNIDESKEINNEKETSVYDQETCPVDASYVDEHKEKDKVNDNNETEETITRNHNSEDILNADTQSLTSQNTESAEIMLHKTQSIDKESDELLPSSNGRIESSPNLFDDETDDLLDNFDIETPPSTATNNKEVQKEDEEKDDVDSESEMFIESSQDVVQCNRSRLVNKTTSSQLTLVPPSQDDLIEEDIKNPVEDGSDVSEAGSENLMDDLEDGDLTDDDLQSLFDKQHQGSQDSELSTLTTSQTTNTLVDSQNKESEQLDHLTPSDCHDQERPSSEIIPASQVVEPGTAPAKLARTTTNYSLKSMEETNLDYQSSQESDIGFKETLSGLIDNLNVTSEEIEETLIEQNEKTVIKNKDTNITTSLPTSMIETPIKTPKRHILSEEEEEITSPIIARNQSSQSLKGLNDSANSSNPSLKKITNISSLVNIDNDSESDSEPLMDMPDIDNETKDTADDYEELEIGPSTFANDAVKLTKSKDFVAETSKADSELVEDKTPKRKTVMKLSEIVLKTPVQARLCGEANKAQDSPIGRPESGPFLPDTLVSYACVVNL